MMPPSFRPLKIDTNQFGAQWKVAKCNYKLEFPQHSLVSAASFNYAVEKHLNFYPIQVIQAEAISAASYRDQTILLHAKVVPNNLQLLIRTQSDNVLSQLIAKNMQTFL